MSRTNLFICCLAVSVLGLALGCDAPAPSSTSTASSAPQPASAPQPPGPAEEETYEEVEDTDQSEDVERQVAEVGVGKKGRGYGGGVVSEPIRAMFRTEQRLQLMNMDRAMKMYKAEKGYSPKTHDIFMDKIIKANGIELPELPEGERYVYDPEQAELMVERPKQ